MDIYVVQPGDTIRSIAARFGVSADFLIRYNELEHPNSLVPGETIVIVYPRQTYTVQDGDSLLSIANAHGISVMQLLRNNPFLSDRRYIFPGESLIISYNTKRSLSTIGFAYPYINRNTLRRTLPSLTYISVFNYQSIGNGDLISYFDDTEIIRISKEYGTIPLMLITTLTARGVPNVDAAYSLLLNADLQEQLITNIIDMIRAKGYVGINIVFNYLTESTQRLYDDFAVRIASRLRSEGYLFFVTINPHIENENSEITFDQADYSIIDQSSDFILFLQFIWGNNTNPPAPVSSISDLRALITFAVTTAQPEKLFLGKPIISYDWALPYVPDRTIAYSLTLNSALNLASEVGAVIQFDEPSQTPYFTYEQYLIGTPIQHIVWSIDARSINAMALLIDEYNLKGPGIWNVMIYYPQLWLVLNSQYDIEKIEL